MRTLDTAELGGVIGSGKAARIHALRGGRAIKLFHHGVHVPQARREFMVSRALFAAGAPGWRVDELVECGGRLGIVGERIEGETLFEAMRRSRRIAARAPAALARLNHRIARTEVAQIRLLRCRWIAHPSYRPDRYGARVLQDHGLCHGDLHLRNVLIDGAGRLVVIDWAKAFYGPVVTDMCRLNASLANALLTDETRSLALAAKKTAVIAHQVAVCLRMGWPMLKL